MPTDREWKEGVFSCTVWAGGSYEGTMTPGAAPHIMNAIQNMLGDLASYLPPGKLRDGIAALSTQAGLLDALAERMEAEDKAPLTDAERETLERFRAMVSEDKATAEREGWSKESLLSAFVIAARHFATGESVVLRRALLEAAAEVSGVPMEGVPVSGWGHKVRAWRPARGEVGWLPYVEPTAEEWARATP